MTEDSLFSEQDSTQDDTSSKKRTWKVEKGKNKEIIPSGISRRTAHDDMLDLFDVEDVLDIPEYASTQMTIVSPEPMGSSPSLRSPGAVARPPASLWPGGTN